MNRRGQGRGRENEELGKGYKEQRGKRNGEKKGKEKRNRKEGMIQHWVERI